MKVKPIVLAAVFLMRTLPLFSQQERGVSLQDVVLHAQSRSTAYKVASTQKELSYYRFNTFESDLKPQVSLYGTLPAYTKSYTSVVQPDGSVQFLPVQQNLSTAGFSLSQELPLTGGTFSLNTALSQFYDFRDKFTQYNGTPIFLHLNQPVLGFNDLKWRKRIEPLIFEEAQKAYALAMEDIARQTVKLYFDVLDAQVNIEMSSANLKNDTTNYNIENKRIDLGTTSENRLMQLQLRALRSRQELDRARYDLTIAQLALRTYIGLNDFSDQRFQIPAKVPELIIPLDEAIRFVKENRPEYIAFERKKREAQRDVAKAKAEKLQVNLTASFGLNRAADRLPVVYKDLKDQQTLSMGLNVPVLDWGRRRNRLKTAEALEKLLDFRNNMDSTAIIQEVVTLVSGIELLKSNIQLARATDSVAARSFVIANNQFQTGKLTISDLHLAQTEKDNAKKSYIAALRDYWEAYYQLRGLTLFDFENRKSLQIPASPMR